MQLDDRLGRRIRNLRISVTDRCNFRCVYCMPEEGLQWLSRDKILTFEEIERLTRIAVDLGVERVRLTGGEPLVRRDLHVLVAKLAAINGLRDISLTTNGILLAQEAPRLARAGLGRVNISLDSLVRERFEKIVRRDALESVLVGLRAATECFDRPVKVNTVLMRGVNDDELPEFVRLARERGVIVRFIEYMPLDADESWSREKLVTGSAIRAAIDRLLPPGAHLERDPRTDPTAPSRDFVFSDGAPGSIGFIDSVSEPFCDHCNRMRLTADGKLRTCLFSTNETDLAALLRGSGNDGNGNGAATPPASDLEIGRVIRTAVWNKEPGHKINDEGFERASRSMSQIGG